jgi:hypothetical protein
MRPLAALLSLPLLALAAPASQAAPEDYGPCGIPQNPDCIELMDNTACFLNPTNADALFKCVEGGKSAVSKRKGPGCER